MSKATRLQEAANEWLLKNEGWDQGMKPIRRSATGAPIKERDLRKNKCEPEIDGRKHLLPWYRMAPSNWTKGTSESMGLTGWRDGWETRLGGSIKELTCIDIYGQKKIYGYTTSGNTCPSPDSSTAKERLEWRMENAPKEQYALETRDHEGCIREYWEIGEYSHKQMAWRAAWETEINDSPISIKAGYTTPELIAYDADAHETWCLSQPKGRKLYETTWTSSDPAGIKRLIWTEMIKARKQRRSGEKGARAIEAHLGWGDTSWGYQLDREMRGEAYITNLMDHDIPMDAPCDDADERLETLRKALALMTKQQRTAIEWAAKDLTRKQIAQRMRIKERKIADILGKARHLAKKMYTMPPAP